MVSGTSGYNIGVCTVTEGERAESGMPNLDPVPWRPIVLSVKTHELATPQVPRDSVQRHFAALSLLDYHDIVKLPKALDDYCQAETHHVLADYC
ncbi:unnamed protein product [Dicrocoelium dendriticum]|nr:unnamed protein product [Dicrocoelium dendriticum]